VALVDDGETVFVSVTMPTVETEPETEAAEGVEGEPAAEAETGEAEAAAGSEEPSEE